MLWGAVIVDDSVSEQSEVFEEPDSAVVDGFAAVFGNGLISPSSQPSVSGLKQKPLHRLSPFRQITSYSGLDKLLI